MIYQANLKNMLVSYFTAAKKIMREGGGFFCQAWEKSFFRILQLLNKSSGREEFFLSLARPKSRQKQYASAIFEIFIWTAWRIWV